MNPSETDRKFLPCAKMEVSHQNTFTFKLSLIPSFVQVALSIDGRGKMSIFAALHLARQTREKKGHGNSSSSF